MAEPNPTLFAVKPQTKQCSKCRVIKPIHNFSRHPQTKSGIDPRCKQCSNAYHLEHRRRLTARYDALGPAVLVTEKRCCDCKQIKPRESFSVRKTSRDGLRGDCTECLNRRNRDYHLTHPRRQKVNMAKYRYGLTSDQYDAILEHQNGLCAICSQPEGISVSGKPHRLAVDHDHVSGKIRGLLCRRCNIALGHFDDKVENLQAAIQYLAMPRPNKPLCH